MSTLGISRLALLREMLPRRHDTAMMTFVMVAGLVLSGPVGASVAGPFSTFLKENMLPLGIGHDAAGNIFVVGTVFDGPASGFQLENVAARLDPSATKEAYFVHLPGSGYDALTALAVDSQGNAYITGHIDGGTFPATSGFGGPIPYAASYPFAIKLDPNGAVVYAVLFAGPVFAVPTAIAVDGDGSAIIAGAGSPGYPVTPGAISLPGGSNPQFVTKLDASGTHILFSALGVGGSHVALGPQGDIFLAGAGGPTTPGAYQTTFTRSCPLAFGYGDGAQSVTRISSDGTRLIYGTFIIGCNGAQNESLAVDSAGNAYVTGTTLSPDYPYTAPSAPGDRPFTFLTKLDPSGSKLLWSVPQGGNSLALDAGENPVVSGIFVPPGRPPGLPEYIPYYPPPPPGSNTPAPCLPNATTVQSIAYVQRFNAQDGSMADIRFLSATQVSSSSMTVEPDGRIVLAGYTSLPDVPLSPGVLFSDAVAQRTISGTYLAAFDLSQPATGAQLGCVLDSASMVPVGPVAPGQLISLFGNEIGPPAGLSGFVSGQSSLPTSLAGVQVTFDGTPAPLLYVSSGQVNVQVPFEVAQKDSTVMTVSVGSNVAAVRMFAVTPSNPSLFLDTSASPVKCDPNLASTLPWVALLAMNSDGSRNSCDNPAVSGSVVTIFLNGVAATAGGAFPPTGSITGFAPAPFASQVDVRDNSGEGPLPAGPLYPVPGTIAGVYQLAVQLPTLIATREDYLRLLSIGGVPAGPFAADSVIPTTISPTPAIVWVKP
jgi:uncharacterized protein (TIGR03437 family)